MGRNSNLRQKKQNIEWREPLFFSLHFASRGAAAPLRDTVTPKRRVFSIFCDEHGKKILYASSEDYSLFLCDLARLGGVEGRILSARVALLTALCAIPQPSLPSPPAVTAPSPSAQTLTSLRARLAAVRLGVPLEELAAAVEAKEKPASSSPLGAKTGSEPEPPRSRMTTSDIVLNLFVLREFAEAHDSRARLEADRLVFGDLGFAGLQMVAPTGAEARAMESRLCRQASSFFASRIEDVLERLGTDHPLVTWGEAWAARLLENKRLASGAADAGTVIVELAREAIGQRIADFPHVPLALSEGGDADDFREFLCVLRIPLGDFNSHKTDLLALGTDKFNVRLRASRGFATWEKTFVAKAKKNDYVVTLPILVKKRGVRAEDIVRAFVALGLVKGFVEISAASLNKVDGLPGRGEVFFSELAPTRRPHFYVCRHTLEAIEARLPVAVEVV